MKKLKIKWPSLFSMSKKDMYHDASYIGKNDNGDFLYALTRGILSGGKDIYKNDYNLTSLSDKSKALHYCQPFGMVIDRCGELMKNGVYYVVDSKDNSVNNEILSLLNAPNVLQNGKAFLKQMEMFLKCYGFCPVVMVRSTKKSTPKAMYIVNPEYFHMKGHGRLYKQYKKEDVIREVYIEYGGTTVELEDYEYFVVYDSIVNIPESKDDDITFFSKTDTLSLQTINYMSQLIGRGNLIKNGGPIGILYNNDNSDTRNYALTPEEGDRINEEFKHKYGIVNKAFEILVTSKNVGYTSIGSNIKDMMLHEEDVRCVNDIANTIGLSPDVFTQGATYDNKQSAQRDSYQNLTIPDSLLIAESLTNALCSDGLRIKIDFSDVSCLQEDLNKKATALRNASSSLVSLIKNRLLTDIEARIELSKYLDIDPNNPNGEFREESINNEQNTERDGNKPE